MIKDTYAVALMFPCMALAAPIECGPYQDPAAFIKTIQFPHIPVVQVPQLRPQFMTPPGAGVVAPNTQFPMPPSIKR